MNSATVDRAIKPEIDNRPQAQKRHGRRYVSVHNATALEVYEERVGAVTLPRSGAETVTVHCPNIEHGDHKPSFVIRLDRDYFHCYGCGWQGEGWKLRELLREQETPQQLPEQNEGLFGPTVYSFEDHRIEDEDGETQSTEDAMDRLAFTRTTNVRHGRAKQEMEYPREDVPDKPSAAMAYWYGNGNTRKIIEIVDEAVWDTLAPDQVALIWRYFELRAYRRPTGVKRVGHKRISQELAADLLDVPAETLRGFMDALRYAVTARLSVVGHTIGGAGPILRDNSSIPQPLYGVGYRETRAEAYRHRLSQDVIYAQYVARHREIDYLNGYPIRGLDRMKSNLPGVRVVDPGYGASSEWRPMDDDYVHRSNNIKRTDQGRWGWLKVRGKWQNIGDPTLGRLVLEEMGSSPNWSPTLSISPTLPSANRYTGSAVLSWQEVHAHGWLTEAEHGRMLRECLIIPLVTGCSLCDQERNSTPAA